LFVEHKKAIEEIAARIEHEDDWFKWQFLVVGAFFIGGCKLCISEYQNSDSKPTDLENNNRCLRIDKELNEIIISQYFLAILSLTFILSTIIGIYEIHNLITINQIGLWITYFVEPYYYGKPIPSDEAFQHLIGWEQFIRQPDSIQTDVLNTITGWTTFHYLTITLYCVYLVILYMLTCKSAPYRTIHWYTNASFGAVHLAILVFAFVGHSIPGNFHFVVYNWHPDALQMSFLTTICTAMLFLLNIKYIMTQYKQR
jgi:hypothetical protein